MFDDIELSGIQLARFRDDVLMVISQRRIPCSETRTVTILVVSPLPNTPHGTLTRQEYNLMLIYQINFVLHIAPVIILYQMLIEYRGDRCSTKRTEQTTRVSLAERDIERNGTTTSPFSCMQPVISSY
ncbi:hypothetical protein EVAR_61435_1 [Eumeta japonica]|uniref:Uncharacterized protein n=1 Tax=Eumeta variegata TaxID=151549 RepID=A0A4C1Y4U0_EUMVA|nr:hypothetical protein EVAR_61435_1 [Eumeta japonica]